MPNYGFKCEKCGIIYDCVLPLSMYQEVVKCPQCNSKKHVRKTYNHPIPIKFNCKDFSTTYRG